MSRLYWFTFQPESCEERIWGMLWWCQQTPLSSTPVMVRCPVPDSSRLTHSLQEDRRRRKLMQLTRLRDEMPLPEVVKVLKTAGERRLPAGRAGTAGCSFEGGHPCWGGRACNDMALWVIPINLLSHPAGCGWVGSLPCLRLFSVPNEGEGGCLFSSLQEMIYTEDVANSLWVTGLQSPLIVPHTLTSVSFTISYKTHYQLSKRYH